MPNAITRNNKEARRARIAAAKKERNAAGENMFSPKVGVKVVGITNAPHSEVNTAELFTGPLKGDRTYTGKAYSGQLSPAEKRQMYSLGLTSRIPEGATSSNIANSYAVARERNAANTATRRNSNRNGLFVTGNSYVRKLKNNTKSKANNHMRSTLASTRNNKEANLLEERARSLLSFGDDPEAAANLMKKAKELRHSKEYTVAEPSNISKNMARNAQMFANEIHRKQRMPEKGTLLKRCLGQECRARNGTPLGGRRTQKRRTKK